MSLKKKYAKGFEAAKKEHIWENRLTLILSFGLIMVVFTTFYNKEFAFFIAFFTIFASATCHVLSRLNHKKEQEAFKKIRHKV